MTAGSDRFWMTTIYDGERYGTEADATSSRLAVMDRCREMVHTDSPVLEDDLSMGADGYSLGGGYEDDDY